MVKARLRQDITFSVGKPPRTTLWYRSCPVTVPTFTMAQFVPLAGFEPLVRFTATISKKKNRSAVRQCFPQLARVEVVFFFLFLPFSPVFLLPWTSLMGFFFN